MRPRHILFVTPYYPPYTPVGAIRMPKLVKYWRRQGHDVSVIAVENPAHEGRLGREDDGAEVSFLPYTASGAPPVTAPPSVQYAAPRARGLKRIYRQIMTTPDRYRSFWVRRAAKEGAAVHARRPVDVVVSSGPPQSAHLAAARIAAAIGRPWVAEQRDIWIGNPYSDGMRIVRWWNDWLGHRTLSQASGFVALTQEAGRQTSARFGKPFEIAYNGFDPEDFAGLEKVEPLDPERLTVVHAGIIYAERRDPSALFEAIVRLGPKRSQVRAIFYHDEARFITELKQKFGVADQVELHSLQPRSEILRIERQADVLLLCRWNDRRDDGIIPGKLFEYIGARRPILAVGSETGEAVDIVRAGGFGLASNDPATIAAQLDAWIEAKRAVGGRLPDVESPTRADYDRAGQFDRIETFIDHILADGAPTAARANQTR